MIKNYLESDETTSLSIIDIDKLLPHEEVIVERKNKLVKYLESGDTIIIPSIICCKDSLMIIDGHHRYFAIKELGISKIAVTLIDYKSENIRTNDVDYLQVDKNALIKAAKSKLKLFPPKTTKHQIKDIDGNWRAILLISSLVEL